MSATGTPSSVLFYELNEASEHFLTKYIAEGKLPALARMRREGAFLTTRIPTYRPDDVNKSWRDISPWIIWPSIYTGMTPEAHGIVGFGQDVSHLRGRFLWDVLDAHGHSVGVFGDLMSYPPRTAGNARYYIPEALADAPDCFPESARPVHEFCVYTARNYSEPMMRHAVQATKLLLQTVKAGVGASTVARVLAQVPFEKLVGPWREPERALLQSRVVHDSFQELYGHYRPAYASVHFNHIAYMQHRFWRAAEPEKFSDELSLTDKRFFGTVAERKQYESKLSDCIESAFRLTDQHISDLMELVAPGTLLLIGTALGQKPMDPVHDIHNPVVRLSHAEELFRAINVVPDQVLHQMNPDVTVNLPSEGAAETAERAVRGLYVTQPGQPLFTTQRRGKQLFLELNVPDERAGDTTWIRHAEIKSVRLPLTRFLQQHHTNDQSTAHHEDRGWLLAWRKGGGVRFTAEEAPVTTLAPMLLSHFNVPTPSWMQAGPSVVLSD